MVSKQGPQRPRFVPVALILGSMRIDLHTHSNISDGTQSPRQLIKAAAAARLDVVALTDHDSTLGWAQAAAQATASGVALVRGAEISATHNGVSVHLLSYLHDPEHPGLVAQNLQVQNARTDRARHMVDLLSQDFALDWDSVLAQTVAGTTIGRPHLADALVACGAVADRTQAFETILRPGSPYYVPHFAPGALDAISNIRAAGGVAVFAHPGANARGRVVPDAVIGAMREAGLQGLEVDHRDNPVEQRGRLRQLAQEYDLLITGSSDYHGDGKPNRLGENTTTEEVFAQIEALGQLQVIRP